MFINGNTAHVHFCVVKAVSKFITDDVKHFSCLCYDFRANSVTGNNCNVKIHCNSFFLE